MENIELTYCLNNRLLDKDGNIVKLKQGTKITVSQSEMAPMPSDDFIIRPRPEQYNEVEVLRNKKPCCFIMPSETLLFFEIKTPLFGKRAKTRFQCKLLEDLYAFLNANKKDTGCTIDECACEITDFEIYEKNNYNSDKFKPFRDKYLKVAQKIHASSLSSLYTQAYSLFVEGETANTARANTKFFFNNDTTLLEKITEVVSSDKVSVPSPSPDFGIPQEEFQKNELKYRELNRRLTNKEEIKVLKVY